MSILDDYKPFIDRYGLVQDKPGNTSGNGVRYSSEALYVFNMPGNGDDVIAVIRGAIDRCVNETPLWYLKRHPEGQPTGIDDYAGAVFADSMFNHGFSAALLDEGAKQNYIYAPDLDPKFFLGRFPQLFCIANWVAKRKPSKFQELFWMISVFQGAIHKGQDEKVLSWMLVEIGQGRRWIFKPLIWFWRRQLKKHYGPNGIGQVLSDYYGNPDHPNARYLRGVGV